MPTPSLDDLVAARARRRQRWDTFETPRSAADEIDRRRYDLDREIALAQDGLRNAQRILIEADQRLADLLSRRDEYDALEAEIAHMRMMTTHARYVEREPVVILAREAAS